MMKLKRIGLIYPLGAISASLMRKLGQEYEMVALQGIGQAMIGQFIKGNHEAQ